MLPTVDQISFLQSAGCSVEGEYLISRNERYPNLKQTPLQNITMIEKILNAGVRKYPRILVWLGGEEFLDPKIAEELIKHAEQITQCNQNDEAIKTVYSRIIKQNIKQ